ncbi:ribonuclease HII [uncultured Lacinutrix sp.]|uniref:ribonuclease HII n=1 Tax=uncultured Lacinutrix sp. TaxID=574032 RepID=UPI002635A27A|nr:ribonuclease HII [uncultured Lacinutrix sp.]
MKTNFFSFFILLLISSCTSETKTASLYDFTPENASIIFNLNDIESLKSNLNNNSFIKTISTSSLSQDISNRLKCLDYIKTPNTVVISFLKDKRDSLQYVITTKYSKDIIQLDSLQDHKAESIKINTLTGQKITYKNNILYTTLKDSIAIAASNINLLKSVIEKQNNNTNLQKIASTINKTKDISVLLNNESTNSLTTLFNTENLSFKDFTDYTAFDADVSQDEILLNGITKAKDSSKLINIFKNTTPQENQLALIAPNNCDGFLSFTFDDFSVFKSNLDTYNKKTDSIITNPLFDNIIEIGIIKQDSNENIVLNSLDIISTKEALLGEENKIEDYRQISIYSYSKPDLFETTFYPLVDYNKANFYCIIDQFLVFGNSKESLENIIANYQNETTLHSRDYYKNISQDLSSASSLLHVINAKLLKEVLDTNFDEYLDSNFKPYKTSAIQFIYDDHYAHFNAAVKKNKAKAETGAVTELLNIKLDSDLLNVPQFVINHRTKQKEIVVQDINNKLYLISNTGNILWKKQLGGPVLGKIEQIDIYKNGRLQLVFATPNRVHLIDRTGREVKGYPLKFNDKITQPLSVFDYDKNKKYRLFVTQGKNVLLYDAKGKTVKGFKFSKAKSTINSQPQHIRIANKDYIIIKTEDKLNILNRRGQTRIKTNTNFKFSDTPVFNYNNSFTTVSKDGSLVRISIKGKVSTSKLLGTNTNLTTTSKTLVAQNDNKLKIKSNTLELDFGNYTKPKLFYIKDKIYVSVTDLQSQKVLLFDSRGRTISNFPVYGNSSITLDNIDKDRNLEFITKGDSNSILLYEMN